jgi:hypothetical protein
MESTHQHTPNGESVPVTFVGGPEHGQVAVLDVCGDCGGLPGVLVDQHNGTAAAYIWMPDEAHYAFHEIVTADVAENLLAGTHDAGR